MESGDGAFSRSFARQYSPFAIRHSPFARFGTPRGKQRIASFARNHLSRRKG
jgi:hypothetical protein